MNLKLEAAGKSPILLLDQSIESAMSRVVSDLVVASGPNLLSKLMNFRRVLALLQKVLGRSIPACAFRFCTIITLS